VSLRAQCVDAYAVDLTTDEAVREGLRVVRVVAPQLQPLSFQYRARFLRNARLYKVPQAMGYPPKGEAELNSWPQPFA
jgi:ribosomal protein S12 methylthiotransferase accessory factor